MSTCLSLVRHGRVHNPSCILYGRLPGYPLSIRGLEEARSAARVLRSQALAALFSSPLLRARQTAAEIIKFHPSLEVQINPHINEVASPYEGRPSADVDALNGDIYSGANASYEQPRDVLQRLLSFGAQIRRRFANQHVVAVTHGDVIVFALLWARGRALTPANKIRLAETGLAPGYPATASITTFTFRSTDPNERPHVSYCQPY